MKYTCKDRNIINIGNNPNSHTKGICNFSGKTNHTLSVNKETCGEFAPCKRAALYNFDKTTAEFKKLGI